MEQPDSAALDAINNQLATVRKQLGGLDRIESLLNDTNTILRGIRDNVAELAAKSRES